MTYFEREVKFLKALKSLNNTRKIQVYYYALFSDVEQKVTNPKIIFPQFNSVCNKYYFCLPKSNIARAKFKIV